MPRRNDLLMYNSPAIISLYMLMPPQQSPHETAAWNLIFPVNTTMDVFRDQLSIANKEYQEVKIELEKMREKLEVCQVRLGVLQRGSQEDFEGEKAGLEPEKVRLIEVVRCIRWRLERWVEIILECTRALASRR